MTVIGLVNTRPSGGFAALIYSYASSRGYVTFP